MCDHFHDDQDLESKTIGICTFSDKSDKNSAYAYFSLCVFTQFSHESFHKFYACGPSKSKRQDFANHCDNSFI